MSTKLSTMYVLTEIVSDFKKQLLPTKLHGVQAPDAVDREIEVGEGHRQRLLAREMIRSGPHFWKINRMAACGTGWEWAERMQAASTLAAGKRKADMEKVIRRDSKRSGVG